MNHLIKLVKIPKNFIIISLKVIMNKDSNVHQIYSIKGNESFKLKEVISIFEKVTNKKINILWGSRNYRKREVMNLWDKGIKLPKWKTSITLEEGLSRYKND